LGAVDRNKVEGFTRPKPRAQARSFSTRSRTRMTSGFVIPEKRKRRTPIAWPASSATRRRRDGMPSQAQSSPRQRRCKWNDGAITRHRIDVGRNRLKENLRQYCISSPEV
jgi:hypothetical protein